MDLDPLNGRFFGGVLALLIVKLGLSAAWLSRTPSTAATAATAATYTFAVLVIGWIGIIVVAGLLAGDPSFGDA